MSSFDPENDEYDRGWDDCRKSCVRDLERQIEENQRFISYLQARLRIAEKQVRAEDLPPAQEIQTTV